MNKAKAWIHIAAGVAYLAVAGLVAYSKSFGTIALGMGLTVGFAILLSAYGLFRLWRGIKDLQNLKLNERNEREQIPEGHNKR